MQYPWIAAKMSMFLIFDDVKEDDNEDDNVSPFAEFLLGQLLLYQILYQILSYLILSADLCRNYDHLHYTNEKASSEELR